MPNWFVEYKRQQLADKCRYDIHRAMFILTMLGYGHSVCEVFTCGYENHLLPRTRWKRDHRISRYPLRVLEYPGYMDWWNALQGWNVLIRREDFDNSRNVVVGDPYGVGEPFFRTFHMWDYVLTHMNEYILQHEAIYGPKEMWRKDLYK